MWYYSAWFTKDRFKKIIKLDLARLKALEEEKEKDFNYCCDIRNKKLKECHYDKFPKWIDTTHRIIFFISIIINFI